MTKHLLLLFFIIPLFASAQSGKHKKGMKFYEANDHENALVYFLKAEEKASPIYKANLNYHIAKCYMKQRNYETAITYLLRAQKLKHQPQGSDLFFELGLCSDYNHNYADAIQYYKQSTHPDKVVPAKVGISLCTELMNVSMDLKHQFKILLYVFNKDTGELISGARFELFNNDSLVKTIETNSDGEAFLDYYPYQEGANYTGKINHKYFNEASVSFGNIQPDQWNVHWIEEVYMQELPTQNE